MSNWWARLLRWLMPATGTHASPYETGEMPVLVEEEEDESWTMDDYDVPVVRTEPETRIDNAINDWSGPVVRPFLEGLRYGS